MQRQNIRGMYMRSGLALFFLLAFCGGSLFIIFPQAAHAAVQATYYVSPTGSDSNSGTSINSPFATIDHARQVVETVNGNMSGDIVVYLLGGMYTLNNTITFTPKDSGTNGHQIYYEAYSGQTPVLSGGAQVTGWMQYSGSIYKAHLSRTDKLRSLYVNDRRAMMTSKTITSQGCWGTYSITAGQASWAWVSGSQADGLQFNPSDFPQVSSNISDIEMSTSSTWNQVIVTVRGTTTSGGHTVAELQQPYGAIAEQAGWGAGFNCGSGTQVTVYNAFSLLNTPGQFYFDRAAQTLYYDALPGQNMATATVIAPNDNLNTLLSVEGTSTSNRVQNLTFSGLDFAYSDWNLENVGGSYGKASVQGDTVSIAFAQSNWHNDVYRSIDTIPAAVMVDSSQNITFTRNTFAHTGDDGLAERNDVINSQTIGNYFYDIGGSAFSIDYPQHVYIGDGGTHEKFPPGVEGDCINDVFKDNVTLNTAVLFLGHAAVAAYFVNKFDFEHNVIQNTPYNGLSMGWGWHNFNGASDSVFPGRPTTVAGNNTVAYNDFFNMVQALTDTGAIYTLGAQPNTTLINNYLNGIPNHGKSEGVHMDEGSAGITMTNTVINVSSGTLTYSANNCCEQTNLTITNTYSTNGNIYTPIASNSVENLPMVYPSANWPAAAQSIIQSAGLEAAYQNVGTTPIPSVTPVSTSTPTPTPSVTPTPTPGVTPTPTPGVTPTPTPGVTPTPIQGGSGCSVHYAVTNQWQGGFGASLTITNTSSTAINGWSLVFSFPNGQTITQLWNGTVTQSGSVVTITNISYNGSIPAGQSTSSSPGFNGTWNGTNSPPTAFTLNGVACSVV
ncbi:cellulose-binding domain-containing protein [Dictyobacter arantiisoli]|uniref:CBM2 domain-containing protein n=1 Tax=Dictyobacter arantiisoli TaxID=2014874 RepID=A0A5A5TFV2_9CHLR|nr:cellulose-binding domain-containing protein [Dictyobacter arantiisoli]GCF10237.1 hypothetical protein KDI_38010 [Dictyobacter arantiisoli]